MILQSNSDEALMTSYQLGNEEAFRELYRRYSRRVYGFLKGRVQDETLCNDIFQAVFLRLHQTRSKYNGMLPFVPWLFTLCRNELSEAFRKHQWSTEEFCEETHEAPPIEQESEVEINLRGLSQTQRHTVEMRFYHDFSFDEIAAKLEVTPSMHARF